MAAAAPVWVSQPRPLAEPAEGSETRLDPTPRRSRGWYIRRLLLAADLVGLTAAFVVSEVVFGVANDWQELVAFALTLPAWVVAAKIYGL